MPWDAEGQTEEDRGKDLRMRRNWDDMSGVRVTDDDIALTDPEVDRDGFSHEEQRSTCCLPGGLRASLMLTSRRLWSGSSFVGGRGFWFQRLIELVGLRAQLDEESECSFFCQRLLVGLHQLVL